MACSQAIDTRVLNCRITRASDNELVGLLARRIGLVDEQLAVVAELGELGLRFPKPR